MKKPEEIKKGLECCKDARCKGCPYSSIRHCAEENGIDALEYIKLLEEGIEQWELVAASPGAVEDMGREIARLEAEIERQREKIRVLEMSLHAVNDGNAALQRENLMLEGRLPRWISVEERLPEDGQAVIVVLADRWCMMGWRWQGKWYTKPTIVETGVTHWMPLPEPPKEE